LNVEILPASKETTITAASVIKSGGIIAFKTDTFYGLGVDPLNGPSVQRLKAIKGRDDGKPILLLISDESEVERFILNRSLVFDKATKSFWPGPITFVIRANPLVPDEITAGTGTVGIRLPSDFKVREFVRQCGGALTATSANLAGQPPARTASEVLDQFDGTLDLIIDGGEVTATEPSTVLDITNYPLKLIREGAVGRDLIKAIFEVY
jgi:L-threonylcarbamoyladenylate synthase